MQCQIRQPLGHQALRGVHQEDGLLALSQSGDQSLLLAAVLGVVTRVGLMGDQRGDVGHLRFDVGVDRHPGAVVPLVVVEARPRFVGDDLVDHGFGVGQRIGGADDVAQRAGEGADGVLQPLRRDLVRAAIGVHPLGQRAGSADHRVDARMRGAIAILVAPADRDVEVAVHLLDESDRLTGELAGRAHQCAQMRGDEVGPRFGEATRAGHLAHRTEQPPGLVGQIRRVGGGFVGYLAAQLRVAGVGVDVTGLDAVEPQAQQEVFTDQPVGLHDPHGNCNT